MGSRGAESLLPERLRAAAEQTNDEPLGLQARDRMLGETREEQVRIKRANVARRFTRAVGFVFFPMALDYRGWVSSMFIS